MSRPERVAAAFEGTFGEPPPVIVRAPGRVNLIGEHTDYNEGFVFPMAIDREVRIALRPRSDRKVRLVSLDLKSEALIDLDELSRGNGWSEYGKGVAWALQDLGYILNGFDGVMSGDVPRGSGLSSSAAVELAMARAFFEVGDFVWQETEIARACQRAENHWLGVSSGIMDQLVSAAGREGHALLLDCRSLRTRAVPVPDGVGVLVLDTATRRRLVGSAYNERRAQCQSAAEHFGAAALRDVDKELFDRRSHELPEVIRRRARHVISENERTLQAARALEVGDVVSFGRLMDESHASLRDDFEVSSPALDGIVEAAREQAGCLGARLTGAGFGGCAVALVQWSKAQEVASGVLSAYRDRTGLTGEAYPCRPASGASTLTGSRANRGNSEG